jgi:hypothetical protein
MREPKVIGSKKSDSAMILNAESRGTFDRLLQTLDGFPHKLEESSTGWFCKQI